MPLFLVDRNFTGRSLSHTSDLGLAFPRCSCDPSQRNTRLLGKKWDPAVVTSCKVHLKNCLKEKDLVQRFATQKKKSIQNCQRMMGRFCARPLRIELRHQLGSKTSPPVAVLTKTLQFHHQDLQRCTYQMLDGLNASLVRKRNRTTQQKRPGDSM